MARRTYERNVKVRWAETVADKNNPTVAEWNAATNLTPFMPKDGLTVPNQQNMVDNATIEEVFDAQLPGSYGGPINIMLYRDDELEADPAAMFAWDDRGFILISWFGEPTEGDRIDVWPAASHQPVEQQTATNEMQKVQIQFAGTAEPAKNVALVGPES